MFKFRKRPTYNYLVNLTFFAGSNEPEDVDNKIVIVSSKRQITEEEMGKKFNEANNLLNPYEDNRFPFSYNDGLNIDTLLEGFVQHTRLKVTYPEPDSNEMTFPTLHGHYVIEQWQ